MERLSSRVVYEGKVASVRIDDFRLPDGSTSEREIVAHPGSVAMIAHDGERLWMVRQPREPVGEDALLELPAGKLDQPGETPLECAKRELVEEIGMEAEEWRELKRFYLSPGFADEQCHLFLATGLTEVGAQPSPGERIEVVPVPLAELGGAIEDCEDAKSLVGLLTLRDLLGG